MPWKTRKRGSHRQKGKRFLARGYPHSESHRKTIEKEWLKMTPCAVCGRRGWDEWAVSDEEWKRYVPLKYQDKEVCRVCYERFKATYKRVGKAQKLFGTKEHLAEKLSHAPIGSVYYDGREITLKFDEHVLSNRVMIISHEKWVAEYKIKRHHVSRHGVFAKVVSVTVLEHSPNPLDFLKEQYRVLKKGGQIEVTTDNAQYFRWSIMNFRGVRHEDYCADHYMIFYPKNVSRLLHLVGFKVTSAHFIRDNKKMDRIVGFITRLRILRKDCQYHRFKISARK